MREAIRKNVALLRFSALYVGGVVLLQVLLTLPSVDTSVSHPLNRATAAVTTGLVNLFGEGAIAEVDTIISPRASVTVASGCNGLEVIALLLPAILAFPAPGRSRALAALAAIGLVLFFNPVRVASLFYCGVFAPDWMRTAHIYVWPLFLIIASLLGWVRWASRWAVPA